MASLKKNISYNIIYQFVIVLLPLITTPIVARRLGATNVGIFSYTSSIVSYFVMFGRLGIGLYGNRCIAQHRDTRASLSKVFWELYFFQMFASLFMTVLYCFYCITIAKENLDIAWLQLIVIGSSLFDVSWFLFGLEDFKLSLIRNTVIKIIGFVLIVLFVQDTSDLKLYTLIMVGTTFIGQVVLIPYVLSKVDFYCPSAQGLIKHIKPNVILFMPSIAISLYQVMDKIMLGFFREKNEVGYYEYAEKIISVLNCLITALESAMIPRISNLIGKKDSKMLVNSYIRNTMFYVSVIAPALVLGAASVAKIFAPVYWGPEYANSGILIMILCPGVLFSVIGSVIRTEYILPSAMDKEYVSTLFIGAFMNVIGNTILIPRYGAIGASVSTVIAELCITTILLYIVKKDLPLMQYFKDGILFYFAGLLMYFVVYQTARTLEQTLWNLVFLICFGAALYLALAMLIFAFSKNNLLVDFKKNLLAKIRQKVR